MVSRATTDLRIQQEKLFEENTYFLMGVSQCKQLRPGNLGWLKDESPPG